MELFQFIKQSTGVMLVGQSGTGKTVCLHILSRLLDMLSLPSGKHAPTSGAASESGHRILTSTSTTSSSSQNMSNNNIFANIVKSRVRFQFRLSVLTK